VLGCLRFSYIGLSRVVLGHVKLGCVWLFSDSLRWVVLGCGSLG